MTSFNAPVPSLVLFSDPSLYEELTSSRDTVELATKHVSKKVCEWFDTWRPWQQKMLLSGLTDRCSRNQLRTLQTTLEPVFHRDFVTTVRHRYPSAPFRFKKERELERQRKLEEKQRSLVFKDEYHAKYPDAIPMLKESDLTLFNSMITKAPLVSDPARGGTYSEFSEQLSCRLIVSSINTLRAEPERFKNPIVFDPSPPNVLIIGDSPGSSSSDHIQSPPSPDPTLSPVPNRDAKKLSIISEEPIHLPETPDFARDAPSDEKSLPASPFTDRSKTPVLCSGNSPGGVDGDVESFSKATPTIETPVTAPGTASAPLPNTAVTVTEPNNNGEETMLDPLRRKKKPKKKKEGLGAQLLDLPPLKLMENARRATAVTASDVATIDFFLSDKADKLGFLQREIRRGPVSKPTRVQNLMLPLQKCYKHVKMCSEEKTYVKAHASKLKRHFRKQLKQVWEWISPWEDYEKLSLLSDITKLCSSDLIHYLCRCITMRLRDRIDIDCLPDDVMLRIFSLLDYNDIESSSRVCSRWRYLCHCDKLWMRKCKQIGWREGVPNINHIIVKTRQKSKKIDWKLAYLEVVKICRDAQNARRKPSRVAYDSRTPDGMMRVEGKFFNMTPSSDEYLSTDGNAQIQPQQQQLLKSSLRHGYRADETDDESDDALTVFDFDEYSLFKEEEKVKKVRLRLRDKHLTESTTFDVIGKKRFEQKEKVPEEEEGTSEERCGSRPARKKKRRQEEAEPALDIRPDLRQAKDLLNANLPRRTLLWKEASRSEKQKTQKFAGEVKTVQKVKKLQGHLDSVLCVAISKKRMISGSMDRSIRIWDIHSGKSIHKLYGHMGGVRCLYFAGAMLMSGSWDLQVMIWDLIKFDRRAILTGHKGSISCVEFNSKYLVSASHDKTVRVHHMIGFDLHTVIRGHTDAITSMRLDGNNVITGSSDKTVMLSSLSSGECLKSIILPEHVTSLCFMNDLIIAGNGEGQCYFVNKTTGAVEAGIEAHKMSVTQLALHKNRFFSASSDGIVREWDLVTMTCVRYLQGPKGAIRDLKVDDRRIVSCGDDGIIRIWDLVPSETGRQSAQGDVVIPTIIKAG